MSHSSEILLLLFILYLGISFGAGLYEARLVIPQWFPGSVKSGYRVNITAMQELDSGRKFWAFVTTIPLTLLTLVNLVLAWQSQLPAHAWWLAAALITLIERAGTFSFFIPTIIKFQKADQLVSYRLSRLVASWISLNYVRNVLTLAAWACAMRAFFLYEVSSQ